MPDDGSTSRHAPVYPEAMLAALLLRLDHLSREAADAGDREPCDGPAIANARSAIRVAFLEGRRDALEEAARLLRATAEAWRKTPETLPAPPMPDEVAR